MTLKKSSKDIIISENHYKGTNKKGLLVRKSDIIQIAQKSYNSVHFQGTGIRLLKGPMWRTNLGATQLPCLVFVQII